MGNLVSCEKHNRRRLKSMSKCPECIKDQSALDEIEKIVARFYGWRLSDQQDEDFTWLVNTLKARLD